MTQARQNWLDSTCWQIEFYAKSARRNRNDPEFDWKWLEGSEKARGRTGDNVRDLVKRQLRRLPLRTRWHGTPYLINWLRDNAERLWAARLLLEDDLSKLLFDSHLVLRATSHRQFYFPRIDFADLVSIVSESAFESNTGLPLDYLTLPLRVFELDVPEKPTTPRMRIVSTKLQVSLLNSYRQYLVERNGVDLSPATGDVVFDCGACIGEVSLLFAGLVGTSGEVHLFDPVPLHARYCELQETMNPLLAGVMRINSLAVGEVSREASGEKTNSNSIQPGGLAIDSFKVTSLDDYVSDRNIKRLDVIKMDIEGAEMEALRGAAQVIKDFKPRLTISTYHKPEDLWEIPFKIRELNPTYRMFFGHHSPTQVESVYYAVEPQHARS